MSSIQPIIAFIVVLAVLIFVHELGHFLVARACRVRVLTFAIGFGTTVFSRKRGHTEYAIKAVPLGGYVRMFGEDDQEEMSEEDKTVSFSHKAVWQRMAIVFAGPLFNMLTAALIFCGVSLAGVTVLTSQVGEVQEGSAAQVAGMMPDDVITSIGGQTVTDWEQIRPVIQELGGSTLSMTVRRGEEVKTLTITPKKSESQNIFGEPVQAWLLGISPKGTTDVRHYGPVTAIRKGLERTYEITSLTVIGIVKLVQRAIPSDTIGGPILIAQMAGEYAEAGMTSILLFVAVLSVNLGILNLLPIPVLDGGHLVFLTAEAIMRRPVSVRVREVAQQAGLFALLALMAFAFYNDIMRIITGG